MPLPQLGCMSRSLGFICHVLVRITQIHPQLGIKLHYVHEKRHVGLLPGIANVPLGFAQDLLGGSRC